MENKTTAKGRKPLPKQDKKIPITIFVARKHSITARKKCLEIEKEFKKLQ